jgi:hypothetical protein
VKGSVIPLPDRADVRKTTINASIRTNDDRRKVDRCQAFLNEHGIVVIDCRSEERDVPSLFNVFPLLSANPDKTSRNIQHTPYDSPAIWKARPLNDGKCSKKIATNAAMS